MQCHLACSFTTGVKVSDSTHGEVDFNSRYLQSEEYRQLRAVVDPMFDGLQQEEKASGLADHFKNRKQSSIKYATSFFWQVSAKYITVIFWSTQYVLDCKPHSLDFSMKL